MSDSWGFCGDGGSLWRSGQVRAGRAPVGAMVAAEPELGAGPTGLGRAPTSLLPAEVRPGPVLHPQRDPRTGSQAFL